MNRDVDLQYEGAFAIARFDARDRLARIRVPALVIVPTLVWSTFQGDPTIVPPVKAAWGFALWLKHELPGEPSHVSLWRAYRDVMPPKAVWLVIDVLMSPSTDAILGLGETEPQPARGSQRAALVGLVTTAALPLLAGLPAAFLSGGALLTYAEHPQRFRWRRFLWGCWHWFGAFLLLGVAQTAASAVLFVPLASAAAGVIAAGGWYQKRQAMEKKERIRKRKKR